MSIVLMKLFWFLWVTITIYLTTFAVVDYILTPKSNKNRNKTLVDNLSFAITWPIAFTSSKGRTMAKKHIERLK